MTGHRIKRRFLWLVNNTLNRVTGPLARSGHGPFSLIRHIGRKTGTVYETPLILARVPGGFVAELTYGSGVAWYRTSSRPGTAWSSTRAPSTGSTGSNPARPPKA